MYTTSCKNLPRIETLFSEAETCAPFGGLLWVKAQAQHKQSSEGVPSFPTTSSSAMPVFHMNSHALLCSVPQQITSFIAIPSPQHSVASPALTDHIISTRPLVEDDLSSSQRRASPFLEAVQPVFASPLLSSTWTPTPGRRLFALPPESLMVLMMQSSPPFTSLASQRPKKHTCSLPFCQPFFRSPPPGSGLALPNCLLCDHPPTPPNTHFIRPSTTPA